MRALTAALLVALAALVGCSGPAPAADSVPPSTYIPAATDTHPTKVAIPALHVESNIIDLALQPDGTMAVPPDATDTGWYVDSPIPGRPGPAVLAAHVNWKGTDGPFAHLDQLKAGDQAIVEGASGARVTFVVDRVETYPKDAFPTDQVFGDRPGPELVMITCGGPFDRAAHSYKDNVVAFAKLAA